MQIYRINRFIIKKLKKRKKKRKLTPENIISLVKCKRKRRDDKKID